ncbi:hypothetical protein INR49_009260 [Caranx melampygus]|nr:hypothetical protein INR49_009260 [Caranx melampygus]
MLSSSFPPASCFLLPASCPAAFGADDRIVGGYECRPHSVPWQVSLNNGWHYCGGTLINELWVVSAAHCYKGEDIELRLGEHHIRYKDGPEQFIAPAAIIRHPDYDRYTINNDIMMIKLAEPAQLNQYVQPVALPSSCAPAGTQCLVSGSHVCSVSVTVGCLKCLHCLDLPVLPQRDCERSYPDRITDAMFCAGFLEGGRTPARETPGVLWCVAASCRGSCPGGGAVLRRIVLVFTPRSVTSLTGFSRPCPLTEGGARLLGRTDGQTDRCLHVFVHRLFFSLF